RGNRRRACPEPGVSPTQLVTPAAQSHVAGAAENPVPQQGESDACGDEARERRGPEFFTDSSLGADEMQDAQAPSRDDQGNAYDNQPMHVVLAAFPAAADLEGQPAVQGC